MTPYTPQPGTIPARVLAWFKDQPEGTEVQTGVLADALGQPAGSIIPSLEAAIENGLIARAKRDGRLYWSTHHSKLGVLGSRPVTGDEEVDDAPIVQRIMPAADTSVALVDVPAWKAPEPKKSRLRAKTAPATPAACQDGTGNAASPLLAVTPYERTPGPRPLRIALWSDGQLQIQRGDFELILLAPDETRVLVKYLERMAEASE